MSTDYRLLPWRTGTKNGRTVYALMSTGNKLDDIMVGVMDTPELSAQVVHDHNERLEAK